MSVLEINDLVIDFETDQGVVEAIDHFSLTVRAGEILGVVGESGCGKTTVARSILGVVPQPPARLRAGEIRFQGEDLLRMPEAHLTARIRGKAITVIPQDPLASLNPLFPLRVQLLDLLKWSRRNGTTARAKANQTHVVNLLKAVQLPSPEVQLRKYPHEFSGGQRQRLLIAAALAPEPTLIIADEPTSALDVTVQAQILLLLRGLVKERGTSVFLITHDLGVVAKLCDRVAVMYAGQEAEVAPTASLFRHPSHPYTQKLLDSLPDRQQGEIQGIPGVVPNLIDPPRGCRFHTRCTATMPVCHQERPPAVEIFPDHVVRCHLFPPDGGIDHAPQTASPRFDATPAVTTAPAHDGRR
jgi:oligopeptide/dipeptide ABC transporter ATP-binding protein